MTRPRVSVVTPSYNYGRFLGACLRSVRDQTYENLEHIVLDSCSHDETPDVLSSFARSYDLQISVERDGGQADALNRGFARATGEILCWLNADDFYLDDTVISQAVALLERDPVVDVVTAGGLFVDEQGRATSEIRCLPLEELRLHDTILQPATFWRRRVHRKLRDDLHYTFDWRLFLEMVAGGAHVRLVDERWAAYRMHAVNKTAADPAARRREVADVLRDEWGPWSPRHLWARALYHGFSLSERTGIPAIKSCFGAANTMLKYATARRIFSP